MKFIYLLNADEVDPKDIPQDDFVVYQGHHGDLRAQLADVVLPCSAYTEKGTTWVNTEGHSQLGHAAVPLWCLPRGLQDHPVSPLHRLGFMIPLSHLRPQCTLQGRSLATPLRQCPQPP